MSSKESPKTSAKISDIPAWFDNQGPQSDIIISTRVRLARNLAHHDFPYRASILSRKSIFEQVGNVFKESTQYKSFQIINLAHLQPLQQQYLVEERVISADLLRVDGDRGVICDNSHRVNIMVNEEDHLRLQCIDSGFRPRETWNIIDMIDDNLGQKLSFSYDDHKGFLTSCPTNSGTGLRISFLLHLPGLVLTKAIDAVLQGASQMGISTRGFFGEHSDVVGNFFQLSNQATMGAHESDFIDSTQRVITEVASHERKARERLLKDARLELTDKIYRSFGILLYAQTLTVQEFLNLSSALRFGIENDLFSTLTIEELNRITMKILPAHLQLNSEKVMNETEIGIHRAELVRELLTKKRRKKIQKEE